MARLALVILVAVILIAACCGCSGAPFVLVGDEQSVSDTNSRADADPVPGLAFPLPNRSGMTSTADTTADASTDLPPVAVVVDDGGALLDSRLVGLPEPTDAGHAPIDVAPGPVTCAFVGRFQPTNADPNETTDPVYACFGTPWSGWPCNADPSNPAADYCFPFSENCREDTACALTETASTAPVGTYGAAVAVCCTTTIRVAPAT